MPARKPNPEYQREWRARNPDKVAGYARDRVREPRTSDSRRAWLANHPGNYLLYKSRSRAKLAGLEFTLTHEWIEGKLQGGVCEATGLPFSFEIGQAKQHNPWSPSIDRIDSSKGYTLDNCQLVVWAYNVAKHAWPAEVVLKMAEALLARKDKQ